ncbi:alpha 1,2-mannosyltransferase 2.4.1 [Saitoella coloradoensis]
MPAASTSRIIRYLLVAGVFIVLLYKVTSSGTSYDPTAWTGRSYENVGNAVEEVKEAVEQKAEDFGIKTPLQPQTPAEPAVQKRANATFVTLARNGDVWEMAKSIREVEDRFNHRYNYPWVFLNDVPFSEEFITVTSGLASGPVHYGVIGHDHWSFPPWLDEQKAEAARKDMEERKIIYGGSKSYRHMCRFESGFFYRHELMQQFEYYWRVEPSIEMFCDVEYDPFLYMKENNKKYAFAISLYEYPDTIPTLWDETKKFIQAKPELVPKDNAMRFISDDDGENYNRCHFWSNFEIASMDLWRGEGYSAFFDHLEKAGGFFYERWGDAPVHSIGAALFLKPEEIHWFGDMGYYHVPFTHCPIGDEFRKKCHCNPRDTFDFKGYSCTRKFLELQGTELPKGWEKYK